MNGYTVIDFETTGFSHRKGDRVVEIGLVRVDESGTIVDSWETLINPQRHVGATNIHGISASDVVGAPTFDQIADLFASELAGSVFVAHNARFDADFATGELTSAGRLDGTAIPFVDTLQATKQVANLPNYKLGTVCAALGIENSHAHSALADAIATAELLGFLLGQTDVSQAKPWNDVVTQSESFGHYSIRNTEFTRDVLQSRADAESSRAQLANGGWIESATGHRDIADDFVTQQYFKLLDSALLDRHLTQSEQNQLLAFARDNGLSAPALRDLHSLYLRLLVAGAEADGVVTPHKQSTIDSVARLLGVTATGQKSSATGAPAAEPAGRDVSPGTRPSLAHGIVLEPGDRVTVTGPIQQSAEYWDRYFESRGIQVAGIAKCTKVLIAGDPDSQSGKAKKARAYGIPVIGEQHVPDVLQFSRS